MQSLLSPQLTWVSGLSETIQLMGNSEHRMTEQHSGSSKSHDLGGLCPLGRLVTVNRAVGAGRLVFPVRTLLQSHFSIVLKLLARGA